MSGVTNELVRKSKNISENFNDAEYDVLLSTGEQGGLTVKLLED